MPFTIRGNKKDGYRLFNTDKKEFAKRTFKTREAAENMKKSYMKHKHDGRNKKEKRKRNINISNT